MKYRRGRRKTHLTRNQIIMLVIACCILAGICAGILAAGTTDAGSLRGMDASTRALLQSFAEDVSRLDTFWNSLFKHGKIILIIWLLAFTPVGGVVVLLLLFAKGIGFGYTTMILLRCYGAAGAVYGVLLYLPQNFVMMPACFLISYAGVRLILTSLHEKKGIDARTFVSYFLILLIGCACVVLAASIEAWITPALIHKIKIM